VTLDAHLRFPATRDADGRVWWHGHDDRGATFDPGPMYAEFGHWTRYGPLEGPERWRFFPSQRFRIYPSVASAERAVARWITGVEMERSTKSKQSKNLQTTMLGRRIEMKDRHGEPFRGEIVSVYMAKDRCGKSAVHYTVEFLPGVNVAWNESENSRVLEVNLDDYRGSARLVPKGESTNV